MSDPYHVLREDEALAPLVAEHGDLTLEPADDPFERLVVSVVRQQLSMAAAETIRERLFEQFDIAPGPLRNQPVESLADTGLSKRKAETIRNAAIAFEEHEYTHEAFAGHAEAEVIDELTAITGIGPWTAKMFCMFGLGRDDVFPVEDLGIRRGMRAVCDRDMDRTAMTGRAERWRPSRSIASLYLWRAVD